MYIRGAMNHSQPAEPLMSRRNLLLAGFAAVTVTAFALAWVFPVWPGDEALLLAAQRWQSPLLTVAVKGLTYLGWYPVAAGLSLVAVVSLLAQRYSLDALLLAIVVSSALMTHPLKALLGRPRPDYAIIDPMPHSMGFPSGHAAFALILGGMVGYLVCQRSENPWLRRCMVAGLGLLVCGVGASRVYLGVHWPSDVLGGYLYGGLVLLAAVRLREFLLLRRGGELDDAATFPKVGI